MNQLEDEFSSLRDLEVKSTQDLSHWIQHLSKYCNQQIHSVNQDLADLEDKLGVIKTNIYHIMRSNEFNIGDYNVSNIIEACERGILPAVKYYMESEKQNDKTSIDARNTKKQTLLMIACRNGYLNIAEYLCKKGIEINAMDVKSKTALYYAVERNRRTFVDFLIYKGADVNIATIHKESPLHKAIELDNMEIVKILVKNQASLTYKNHLDKTPVEFARHKSRDEIENYLKNVM